MIFIDRLLVGGLHFVFDKVAAAADTELDDQGQLRDRLLEAQLRLELGELTEAEFHEEENVIIAQLRALRKRRK